MDLNGLEALIKANHSENQRQFKEIKEACIAHQGLCSDKMKDVDDKLVEHDKFISKLKNYGSVVVLLWTSILAYLGLSK